MVLVRVHPLESPCWFGRYRLTSRIATGGMAEIYAGRKLQADGGFGPMVALKRLLPHLMKDPRVVRMFLNEARITRQIDHPNVVRVLDLGQENGEPYITMELLEGSSFAEVQERAAHQGQRVPLGVTLQVLSEACRGLHAAHRAVDEEGRPLCLVHRDFTPENIHVGVNGAVKVLDFGIAKTQGLNAGTEPGTLKGKFFYMSPEMIAGKEVDHRADLFAAGVMLYEQLCGRRPFTGNTAEEVVRRISEGAPRRPAELDPSVPPALEAICLMALRREPEARFPSLEELIRALESVGGVARLATREEVGAYLGRLFPAEEDPGRQLLRRARQLDPSLPDASTQLVHPRWRPSRKVWGVLIALCLFAGGAAFFLTRPQLSPSQRLKSAAALQDLSGRASLLRPLGNSPTATAEELSQAGQLLLAVAGHEEALELAGHYAARFPMDSRAHLLEARAAIELRLGKRAEAALERASALAPSEVEADLLLSELRERQGDRHGALEALSRAQKKRPGSTELASRRGYLLSQTGQLEPAAEVLESVLSKHFDPTSASELAFVRFRQGQTEEALSLLRRALKREPKLQATHYYLGAVLYRQGDARGAERSYREADRLDPGDPRPLLALCEMQAQTRSPQLEETRKLLASRFPQRTELLAGCQP